MVQIIPVPGHARRALSAIASLPVISSEKPRVDSAAAALAYTKALAMNMRAVAPQIKLERAMLCVECETIGTSLNICHACGSSRLLSMAKILNRKTDDALPTSHPETTMTPLFVASNATVAVMPPPAAEPQFTCLCEDCLEPALFGSRICAECSAIDAGLRIRYAESVASEVKPVGLFASLPRYDVDANEALRAPQRSRRAMVATLAIASAAVGVVAFVVTHFPQ